jgi:uridylate kinase
VGRLFVLSVGGSLLVPDEVDAGYLGRLRSFVLARVRKGERFVLVVGGGKTARRYIRAAQAISGVNAEDRDWLGIHSTRLNAHLLRAVFRKHAHFRVVKDPRRPPRFREKVLIAAGWRPGITTDYDAALLAEALGAREVVNLTDVDFVYDRDPRRKGARALPRLTWKEYLRIAPPYKPGVNAPFDPRAARESQRARLDAYVLDGHDFANLGRALDGKPFRGTLLTPP